MTFNLNIDMTGFSKREDGVWRSDQAEKAHQAWLASIREDTALIEQVSAEVSGDKLATSIVDMFGNAGLGYREKYLMFNAIRSLIRREIGK